MWDIWANQFGGKECFLAVQDGSWDDQHTSNRWRHDYGLSLSISSDKGTSNTNVSGIMCVYVCMHAACVMLSHFSLFWLFAASWSEAYQTPLSMGFSRQEYWNGCYALLQGIFQIQVSNPSLLCLLLWQIGFLQLAPPGKPI